ncbi:MAG: PEGA domain-containing protein [Terracidiphilus sp.]|nr:PEGA domain-containing protein [Terracidiphilus sp.]
MLRRFALALLLCASALPLFAADQQQIVLWPDADHPVLRFTFGKFKSLEGSSGNQRPYAVDTVAENVSTRLIESKQLNLYVFDKKQIRIAEGFLGVTNLAPGQSVRFQTSFMASGSPASLQVVAQPESQRRITLTVNSVPQGASLKVDGVDAGITPKLIEIGPGKHRLDFSKDGFRSGVFPLEIGARDVSGGSISYELGAALFDTIELRDGTVLSGDLDSIQGMDVVVRIAGSLQRIDRNKVKRILLAQREAPEPSSLPPADPK